MRAKILETFKPMLQAQIQQGMVIEKNGFYQTSANYQNKKKDTVETFAWYLQNLYY
jgi:hypothetical protein